MTRARILADYVSSGDELADKAPLASPAFTGTPTGITAAHITSGVLPVGVTGGSGLTALGTVTAGNLSNTAIVYPTGHVIKVRCDEFRPAHTLTSGTTTIATMNFTPDAKTNNLFIECLATFQLYGNGTGINPAMDVDIYHNGTLIDSVHDVHNNNVGSNLAHNFVQPTTKDLITVDHASASGARDVEIKIKWTSGRYYTATSWYGHRISITEIA